MEKDIGRIKKNDDTEIVLRIDDFGGNKGLTIREFVKSEKYTGFTKAGVRIRSDKFEDFKKMINSVNPKDLEGEAVSQKELPKKPIAQKSKQTEEDEDSGIDEEGLM